MTEAHAIRHGDQRREARAQNAKRPSPLSRGGPWDDFDQTKENCEAVRLDAVTFVNVILSEASSVITALAPD
jgi:hypothetical protein